MRITVHGGVLLGVAGMYKEKTYTVDSVEELHQAILKELSMQAYKKSSYNKGGRIYHTFEKDDGEAVFEYVIREVTE